MTPASIPSATLLVTGTRTLSTASRHRPPIFASGFGSRLEKAVSWLQPGRTTVIKTQQHHHHYHRQRLSEKAALFSTSSRLSSKEEDDLYMALTASFRTRLAEQTHKPEDGYKAVIEHWTEYTQKSVASNNRSATRRKRLDTAVKLKDIDWIQTEQDRLELEANGTAHDYFNIIQAWYKCDELKRAILTFEQMESIGAPLTISTLVFMLNIYIKLGNLTAAGAMVQKMEDRSLHPHKIVDLKILLKYYIKITPTPSFSYSTSTAPSASYSADDTGATTTQRTSPNPSQEHAHEVWSIIEKRLDGPDRIPLNALGNLTTAYMLYLSFLTNKIRDLDKAAKLINKMVAKDVSPHLERYASKGRQILNTLIKHGYFTEVIMLLRQEDAELAKVTPQATWDHLMEACIAKNENQMARGVYDDMIRYGIPQSVKCSELFSKLQQLEGTMDRANPSEAGHTRNEAYNLLDALFNRQQNPLFHEQRKPVQTS